MEVGTGGTERIEGEHGNRILGRVVARPSGSDWMLGTDVATDVGGQMADWMLKT